jgi:hypothetical protein
MLHSFIDSLVACELVFAGDEWKRAFTKYNLYSFFE